MIRRVYDWIDESEVRIALLALFVIAIVLFFITWLYDPSVSFSWVPDLGLYNQPEFWENVLVESHGMLLDLLIIGVFIFWLQKRSAVNREKKHLIQRYQEELDDYRGWKEDEAAYRVAGVIKRLEAEGIKKIKFDNLHLGQCSKEIIEKAVRELKIEIASLQGAKLMGAKLQGTDLKFANLQKAYLYKADLKETDLRHANLRGAFLQDVDLRRAFLHGAKLEWANLENTNLQGAFVHEIDWIEKLKERKVGGAEEIEAKYYVDNPDSNTSDLYIYIIKERPKGEKVIFQTNVSPKPRKAPNVAENQYQVSINAISILKYNCSIIMENQ